MALAVAFARSDLLTPFHFPNPNLYAYHPLEIHRLMLLRSVRRSKGSATTAVKPTLAIASGRRSSRRNRSQWDSAETLPGSVAPAVKPAQATRGEQKANRNILHLRILPNWRKKKHFTFF